MPACQSMTTHGQTSTVMKTKDFLYKEGIFKNFKTPLKNAGLKGRTVRKCDLIKNEGNGFVLKISLPSHRSSFFSLVTV